MGKKSKTKLNFLCNSKRFQWKIAFTKLKPKNSKSNSVENETKMRYKKRYKKR